MYPIVATKQFGKDYKKCIKAHFSIELLDAIVLSFSENCELPAKNKSRKLARPHKNCWECHVAPDWILIWQVNEKTKTINLVRTGTHFSLFK